jgi:type 2 lantibiotic biosynthesis protein LanM
MDVAVIRRRSSVASTLLHGFKVSMSDPTKYETRVRRIVVRAMELPIRTRMVPVEQTVGSDLASSKQLMDRWRKAFSPTSAFERRLAWDGWSEETALHALADQEIRWDSPLPRWARTLVDCAMSTERSVPARDPVLRREQPLPFQELLLPFLVVARSRLAESAGTCCKHFTQSALLTLERALLKRLSWISERTLGLEFSIFRATHGGSGAGSNSVYRAFIGLHLSTGLLEIADAYPVLARLMATATDQWVDAQAEMFQRITADRRDLQRLFGNRTKLGKVTDVRSMLSDFHNGGRSVSVLYFTSGIRIVYKPKDIELEACWNELLRWINSEGVVVRLRTCKVFTRGEYGWVEYVDTQPCISISETVRFSRRAGMLLFLGYLLDANDLHHENVIRCGEHPVIVDLETLLHPWVAPLDSSPEESRSARSARDSVLRSGLLPIPGERAKGIPDLSGFRAGPQPRMTAPIRWVALNSDAMALAEHQACFTAEVPASNSRYGDLDYTAVQEGFSELYQLFLVRKKHLAGLGSVLQAFSSRSVRFVFRATGDYGYLLTASLKPMYMRNGVSRSVFLDGLARTASAYVDRPNFWPVIKAEMRALESMDVPLFIVRSDSVDFPVDSGEVVDNYFREPGIRRVLDRLESLSGVGLELQLALINTALRDER